MRRATLLLVMAGTLRAAAAHPLTPLSAAEIRTAVRIFHDSGRVPAGARFSIITLAEPPKEQVLRGGAAVPRRAFAVIYDASSNRTWEAVADLSTSHLDSFQPIPGAQPAITYEDSEAADRIVRADPRWQKAMRERGISDSNNVAIVAWSAGYFALPGTGQGRIVRALSYYAAGRNIDAHPVEGVVAHVNLSSGKIIDFLDIDRKAPVSHANFELDPASNRPLRTAPAPLSIIQAQPGFQIEDGEVRWQKWRFRYALDPREGLVLYTVGYEDGGRVRSILYRGALSEMVVPYGDPGAAWFFRNSFDAGELGLGENASTLRPGIDCPTNCFVFDAVVADSSGAPHALPGAIALYERDAGIAWKHGDDARRARELVLSFISQVGNYDYGFDWIFHQDGALEMRVSLTGVMAVKGVEDGRHDSYSHLVAPNIAAPHHQHFFTFRLDMDVDGLANRAVELNSAPAPAGPQNPFGGAFTMQETPLRTERQAERHLNLATSRRWIIESTTAQNALGHPTGYTLLPGENAEPFAAADSWVRKRAGFLNAHVWVTPYRPSEKYAGGDYPNQSPGGGLPKWTAANRSIDGQDVVLWYTMGVTHNPRPEDFPVMPVHAAGFRLIPWGFFTKNPALDLP